MSDKPYLSFTQLDMLSKCGEQYRRRYIEGEKIPPGIAMITGIATDRAVTSDLQSKIDSEQLLPDAEIMDIARDTVVEFLDGDVTLTEEEMALGLEVVGGRAVDKAVRLSSLHHNSLAPCLEPTHVQREIRIPLEGYPRDLMGIIDIQEGSSAVRDTKTSAKSPTQSTADHSAQLTIYAWCCLSEDGRIPKDLYLDYLVDTKQPKLVPLRTTRTVEDLNPMLRRFENALTCLERGVFVPSRETDWWCNPRWCGYYQTCPYVRQSVFAVGEAENGRTNLTAGEHDR